MKTDLKRKVTALSILMLCLACSFEAFASIKNVMCVKTNTGQYFPVVRVSMMVVPDGGNTFEIVLKDGPGEANVESISFEKHDEEIDFDKYKPDDSGDTPIDMSKKVYLMTNTGKYFTFKTLPTMTAKDGSELFDVQSGSTVEKDVESVFFYRGDVLTGIDRPIAESEENLQLMTPISQQMLISGCGNATEAIVYDMTGKEVGKASVADGISNIYVGHLSTGAYVVKVGKKSLKFMKK